MLLALMAKRQNPRCNVEEFKEHCRSILAFYHTIPTLEAISKKSSVAIMHNNLVNFYQTCKGLSLWSYICCFENLDLLIEEVLKEIPTYFQIRCPNDLLILNNYLPNEVSIMSKLKRIVFERSCVKKSLDATRYKCLTDQMLMTLANNNVLEFLDMFVLYDNDALTLLNSALRINKTLKTLKLFVGSEFDDQDRPIALPNLDFLLINQTLSILHISTINACIIRDILLSLPFNKHLQEIRLTCLHHNGVICCRELTAFNTLFESSVLTKVDIAWVDFENLDPNCNFGLDKNSKLETLIFRECKVSSATAIVKALATNTVLQNLVLPDVGTTNFVEELAKSLLCNHTLKNLDILCEPSKNKRKANDYKPLFEVLGQKRLLSLETLCLCLLDFNSESAQMLAKMLSVNKSLLTLRLEYTIINYQEMRYIFTGLQNNIKLKKFIDFSFQITDEQIEEFQALFIELMKINNTLVDITCKTWCLFTDNLLQKFMKLYLTRNKKMQLTLKTMAARLFIQFIETDHNTLKNYVPEECIETLNQAKRDYQNCVF